MAQPPPLSTNPYLTPQSRPMPQPQQQSGAVSQAVMSGVRFKIVPYVFSVLIMTFRRNMGGVEAVSTGNWQCGSAIGAAFITTFLGWWGFPWGIIWTVPTLFHLWNGGRDITSQMLIAEVGPIDAKRILATAPRPRPPAGIWVARGVILLPVLLFVLVFATAVTKVPAQSARKRAAAPTLRVQPAPSPAQSAGKLPADP